jgi:hypothetical protein
MKWIIKWIRKKCNPCSCGGFHRWIYGDEHEGGCVSVTCIKCKLEAWKYIPPH